MQTLTAIESLNAITESTETIDRDKPQQFPEAASAGDTFRQGDLYITKMDRVPEAAIKVDTPNPQLAEGTTQGSRHVLDSLDGVTLYCKRNATALDGPVVELTEQRVLGHPEHGDVVLPAGCYAITYQRAYADELRRVAD